MNLQEFLLSINGYATLVASDGTFLGVVSSNQYDINSICHPHAQYGSPHSLCRRVSTLTYPPNVSRWVYSDCDRSVLQSLLKDGDRTSPPKTSPHPHPTHAHVSDDVACWLYPCVEPASHVSKKFYLFLSKRNNFW